MLFVLVTPPYQAAGPDALSSYPPISVDCELVYRSMDPLQLQHIPILPQEARAMLFVLVTPLFEAPTAEMCSHDIHKRSF